MYHERSIVLYMPKETFNNLNEEKKQAILEVLKDEFQTKPFYDVNVKTIVEKLGIARGSFYQYFENLEDSYFTILNMETVDVHALFMEQYMAENGNLHESLVKYGEKLSQHLFDSNSYNIYKNRYLYWNEDLDRHWKEKYQNDASINFLQSTSSHTGVVREKVHFVKSIIHGLIRRNFQEEWTKVEFLEKYNMQVNWIEEGVK